MDIYHWVIETSKVLLLPTASRARRSNGLVQQPDRIGAHNVGLAHDLNLERLTAAMYRATYNPPFDTIENDLECDIHDHGLYELELLRWNWWAVNHYELSWAKPEANHKDRVILATFKFRTDTYIWEGVTFDWQGPDT